MSDYPIIAGLDRARYEALLNAEILHPLPQNAVLVIGADWCPDTQHSIMDSGYPTQTNDGRPIVYLNDANLDAHKLMGTLEGKEILGGGVDSALPPSRPERQYNYPTVISTRDGILTHVLYADTVPEGGLLYPTQLGELWQKELQERAQHADRPQYEPARGSEVFAREIPAALEPDRVYAVVSSNCGHCHALLARSGYPRTTEDGRPITYLNMAVGSDGKTPVNGAAAGFFEGHLATLSIEGFPTFITTDGKGKPTIAGVGTDNILEQFFPNVLKIENAQQAAAPAPVPETPAAPPPLEERPAAPPPGLAQADSVIKGLGQALSAHGLTASALQTASSPAPTPIERSGDSAARNA